MNSEPDEVLEELVAGRAVVRFTLVMRAYVVPELRLVSERLAAHPALMKTLPGVLHLVLVQRGLPLKELAAVLALVRAFTGVHQQVHLQMVLVVEGLGTLWTLVLALVCVN